MTRQGILLDAAAGVAIIVALGAATVAECGADWRAIQKRYIALANQRSAPDQGRADETVRPHELVATETGAVERCTTCHLGMEPGSLSFDEAPFGAHPGDLLETHPLARFGCTSCHGGQGRALDEDTAHDRRPGGGWSAFTPAAIRCGRCHAAAGLEGTELVKQGANVYLSEGCYGCHQPGRNGPGIGPNLASIGLRGTDYIREVVLYPDRVYPRTAMPPTRFRIGETGEKVDSLVAYLKTLEPWPRQKPRVEASFDPKNCAGCHRVDHPNEEPRGPAHRCSYLHEEARWLACKSCHAARPDADSEVAPPVNVAATPKTAANAREPDETPAARALARTLAAQRKPDEAPAEVDDPSGACPHLVEAFSTCGICHRSHGETR